MPYAGGWFECAQRGCVFAYTQPGKPVIDAANDGFGGIVRVLRRASGLGVLLIREHAAQGRILFCPRGMLGIKDLRQSAPAHIAGQDVLFRLAGHGNAVVRQFFELFNGPQIVRQLYPSSTGSKGAQTDAVVLTRVSIPISSRISHWL